MSSHSLSYVTPEDYLERERLAAEKSEYIDGEIVAMAGGSPRHALICGNVGGILYSQLRRNDCRAFNSDLRVCVRWGSLITYPDVTVICGSPEYTDEKRDTVTNPTLIIEVLSPSTKGYDRGEKAHHYRLLPSLREFLLIEQESVDVEHWRRMPNDKWEVESVRERNATLRLESIACQMAMDEIYGGTELFA